MRDRNNWTGIERREQHEPSDLEQVHKALADLTHVTQAHLAEEALLRPKVEELLIILERLKGVITFFKVLLYIGAPIAAIIAWAKDHIKI